MPFHILAYTRLREGGELAAELPASTGKSRRWIAIYPKQDKGFSVLDFELDKADVDDFFANDLRQNSRKMEIPGEQELYQFLENQGIEPGKFDAPWNCDFPS
jgi:hypothetical protein